MFDTLLDEQTILGTALGAALAGFLPIPEIQYLAYLHNAEDQLRGEAATLRFFSSGQYENGMVVRVAGLAYQKGFGGHFHNDNSVAVLRDIPGLVLAVPSHPASAPQLLRECLALAGEGRVCVFLEPIALYHQRDLHDGDAGWTAATRAVRMARRVHIRAGPRTHVRRRPRRPARDVRQRRPDEPACGRAWLGPASAARCSTCSGCRRCRTRSWLRAAAGFDRVVVVDETRRSGGVSESVVDRARRRRLCRTHQPGRPVPTASSRWVRPPITCCSRRPTSSRRCAGSSVSRPAARSPRPREPRA